MLEKKLFSWQELKFLIVVATCMGSALFGSTTFVLVRHGQTDWNKAGKSQGWSDIPLNEIGASQAASTATTLFNDYPNIAAIYSSDLSRAYETAQATAQLFGLPVAKREALREINNGSGEGMLIQEKVRQYKEKWDELRVLYPNRLERWDHVAIEGEEPLNALVFRIKNQLSEIAQKHPSQTVAIFSHSKAIRTLLADIQDIDIMKVPSLNNADVRVVTFDCGNFKLQETN